MREPVEGVEGEMISAIAPFEVIDLRRTLAEADLEDIIDELVDAFLGDAPFRMDAIASAVESGKGDQVRATAHAYKSAAASIGAGQLAELLRLLEMAGAAGDKTKAAVLLPQVLAAHDTVVSCLQEEFPS